MVKCNVFFLNSLAFFELSIKFLFWIDWAIYKINFRFFFVKRFLLLANATYDWLVILFYSI